MTRLLGRLMLSLATASAVAAQTPSPFTLQQVLSAPYATNLIAAPTGNLFAWVEHTEGRNNLFVGGPGHAARQLTRFTDDDGRDITAIIWSPHADAIAFAYGTQTGADSKPANPAHLQQDMATEIRVVNLKAGEQTHLTAHGHSPLFSRDGDILFWIEGGDIWARALTGDPTPPTPAKPLIVDRGSASQLTLSPDGNLLAYISRRREDGQPSHSFLAVYDLRTHTLRFPAPSTGNDSAPIFSPDGHQLAWLRSPFTPVPEFAPHRSSPNPWSIRLLDLATDQTRTVFTPAPNQRGSVLPHLADSDPRLFFSNDAIGFYSEADGWVHLYEIRPATSAEVQWLTPGQFETEDATFSRDHHTLIYASNQVAAGSKEKDPKDEDRRHLWHLDLTQPDTLPVQLTYGDGIETHPTIAPDGTLAALVSDAQTPMHPALITRDGGILPLRPNALPPDYPASALVTPEQVLFPSTPQPPDPANADQSATEVPLTIHGQLFLPAAPSTVKRPAIVFVHGGPNRQMLLGYPPMDYYSNAYAMNQYLSSRGVIVLSINYRCGIGYGIDFRQCIHAGADGGEEYNDVLAAAKYLRSRSDVDAARIGIWGGSYGGYLTALALARNSNLFAAGVDFHGVHDWNLEDNAADWKFGSNAQRDTISARALASSPLADISHWTSPILLIHGDNDPDVAYAQTPILADALRSRNVPVQELIFPDELHGFLLHKDWLAAYTAAAAFFERTLKP